MADKAVTVIDELTFRFGGVSEFAELLDINRRTIYRWRAGQPALIPRKYFYRIRAVATAQFIVIDDIDLTKEYYVEPAESNI